MRPPLAGPTGPGAPGRHRSSSSLFSLLAGSVLLGLLAGPPGWAGAAGAPEFIRGDANGDGELSLADAHRLLIQLFHDGPPLACLEAGDFDDSGTLTLGDAVRIAEYAVTREEPPGAPFPEAGPDPSPGTGLGCDSYGGGERLEDPGARLELLRGVAPGGDHGLVTVAIAVSSSSDLAGLRGTFRVPPGLVASAGEEATDLTGFSRPVRYASTWLDGDRVHFGYLNALVDDVAIPAGGGTPVLEISLCLAEGAPAGDYPLVLEGGELVDYDTGRSIAPRLEGATLTLRSAVTGSSCTEPDPLDIDVVYELAGRTARPGDTVAVPFHLLATAGVEGFQVSIDFDEEVVDALAAEPVWARPDGQAYDYIDIELDNRNDTPGNGGVDEGYIVGAVVFELLGPPAVHLPVGEKVEVLRFHLAIDPEATAGESTELRFLDGASHTGGLRRNNSVIALGQEVLPERANSFLFLDGRLRITPDVSVFIRGDVNGDERIEMSDAVGTLAYLFRGGPRPACLDAADANDDGRINLADPVGTLQFLFRGGDPLPPPKGIPDVDPTPDGLECR